MPGSIADDFELLEPGGKRFETVSARVPNLSEEAQINTGTLNGLGNRDYTLIETEQQPMARHIFSLDKRPTGQRLGDKLKKFTPFPYDRHDGQGFLREPEIDLEYVKAWYGNGSHGGVAGMAGAVGEVTTGD
jgi:hypothetical protein